MPDFYTVTAELRNWYKTHDGQLVWGHCYGDIKGRFREGAHIHTSMVKEMRDCGDHFLCITLNSAYKLMKDEERNTATAPLKMSTDF